MARLYRPIITDYTEAMHLKIKTPYTFTPMGFVLYYSALALMLTLMLQRNSSGLLNFAGIGSHLSNFALSSLLLFAAGATNLLTKVSWKYIFLCALLLAGANIIMEAIVPVLNTPDMMDAAYGLAGISATLGLLALLQRYGVRPVR
ncbi:MAG: hypothetical protein JWM37_474 [Candidatus Saccharibacteria bacterium]|nr:hypothetical protein [Candidatus Saccharibacteria bacterium]